MIRIPRGGSVAAMKASVFLSSGLRSGPAPRPSFFGGDNQWTPALSPMMDEACQTREVGCEASHQPALSKHNKPQSRAPARPCFPNHYLFHTLSVPSPELLALTLGSGRLMSLN